MYFLLIKCSIGEHRLFIDIKNVHGLKILIGSVFQTTLP